MATTISIYGGYSAMDLLKTTLDPLAYGTLPPAIDSHITFPKSVDLTGTFPILRSTEVTFNGTTESEPVSNGDGAVIWYPGLGAYACTRYGVVNPGHKSVLSN